MISGRMNRALFQPIMELLLEQMASGAPWRSQGGEFPASHYADPQHLSLELRTLFAQLPQMVALSADLPEVGSQITRDQLPVPVLLTRDAGGVVHALANVCAHRGAQVVDDGRHCSRRMSCPYHGWSYDLDGTHVGLPDNESFPTLRLPRPGLRALPVVEEHGLVWVTPSFDAPAPEPGLGALGAEIAALEFDDHRHWRGHRFELALNWKLVIDTFLEGYHFATLHRDTVFPIFVPNLCHAERFGRHLREVLPRRTLEQLRGLPTDQWDLVPHSAIVYVLFPGSVIVVQLDHIETWRISPHPTEPGRSTVDLDFYLPELPTTEAALGHWERSLDLTISTVINEDFAAMAGVQRGLASGVIDSVTAGQNEPALAMFHRSLLEALPA